MGDDRWQRLSALFDAALATPAAERHGWIETACPDPGLRRELEAMLAAHDRAEGVLEHALGPVPVSPRDLGRRIAEALKGRYVVERALGQGGSATVFLAHEHKHARPVVIKVLEPGLATRLGADRFRREVRIAARLAHPNILPLIDSGEADGLLYYVMPYVEGRTLREDLDRTGALPLPEARRLLGDVAAALAYAHRVGVVHRDLKPGNVLCVDGHVFLLDFGVAKLLEQDGDPGLTGEYALGTPAYMAPEQRVPGRPMDHRVDLYAWGLLAHELTTGRLPGDSGRGRGRSRLEVPASLAPLVSACLAEDPEHRPATAEAVLAALDQIDPSAPAPPPRRRRPLAAAVTAVVTLAVVIGGGALLRTRSQPAVRGPVAVAALFNETGDSTLRGVGRFAGDWLTQGLQETGLVPVVPWTTSLQASNRIETARRAGRLVDPVAVMRAETGAGTVVTGSYYLVGDSLQFRLEVADAVTGRVLGAPPGVSAHRADPHQAVDALRSRLMGAVAIWSDERFAQQPELRQRPPSIEAYRAFDRGIELFNAQQYDSSLPDFVAAYALDTSFVPALIHAGIAAINGGEYRQADSFSRAARARDAALSEYHRLRLAVLEATVAGDESAALAAVRRATEIAPESRAWYNLAYTALRVDRPDEALDALLRLDPDRTDLRDWSSYWTQLAHARHLLGQHRQERLAARSLRQRFPDRRVGIVLEVRALAAMGDTASVDSVVAVTLGLPARTYWSQGAAMVVAGEELVTHGHPEAGRRRLERAVDWMAAEIARDPDYDAHRYWLGSALYHLGRWEEAAAQFEDLARREPHRLEYRGLAALTSARLGRPDALARLGEPEPWERGGALAFRARIAAVTGARRESLTAFAAAVRLGVGNLPWLHAAAHRDLELLGDDRWALPRSLRPAEPRR